MSQSLFNQVLKRRKSRQSNEAFCNVDFDYAGDSAKINHMIERRKDLGVPNKQQLDFELRLRTYKNYNGFYAPVPWQYPSTKDFSPHRHWEQARNDTALLNAEFKHRYDGKFRDPNYNHFEHQFSKNTVQDVKW